MVTKGQNKKHYSVSAISLFIQFSVTEIRLVFSHAKFMLTRRKGTEKVGCLCLLMSYSHFSIDRAQY